MATLDDLRDALRDGERFAGDPDAVLARVQQRRAAVGLNTASAHADTAHDEPDLDVLAIPQLTSAQRERHNRGLVGRAWLAPILAAAAVAAITATLVLVRGAGSPHPDQQAAGVPSALGGVVDRTWELTTVQAPDGATTTMSRSVSASVTFLGAGRRIEFQDGISAWRGVYTPTDSGDLRIHDVDGDKREYCGHDRAQLAAIAGIDAIGVPVHRSAPPPIQVDLVSGQLTIVTQRYQLTFDDPVPVAPSASGTPPSPPTAVATTVAPADPTRC